MRNQCPRLKKGKEKEVGPLEAKDEGKGLNDGHTIPHPSHSRKKYKANIAFMTINDGVSSSSSKE